MCRMLIHALVITTMLGLAVTAANAQNLISNWEFDVPGDPTTGGFLVQWHLWQSENFTDVTIVEGAGLSGRYAMKVDIGSGPFDPLQIFQSNLVLKQGVTYTISFMAKADAPRTISMGLQTRTNSARQWYVYWRQDNIQLTTEPQKFTFEYTHTDPDDGGTAAFNDGVDLHFWLAGDGTDLYLDRIWMGEGAPPPTSIEELAQATDPVPGAGATDVPRDTLLSWYPGPFAVAHDVYFGETFEDVNGASRTNPGTALRSQGQTAVEYMIDTLLNYDTQYFWRVDEVNAPPESRIFKGYVWSFTTEPYTYPLANVTATASSAAPNMGPEKTVDGSGLQANGQHSSVDTDMWLSAPGTPLPAWIRFEFDRVYKLDGMTVWNSNQKVEPYVGFGAKDATIEYSLDGVEWSTLGDMELARADGTDTYAGIPIDLAGIMAKFLRLTINTSWSGFIPQAGLSEVRLSYVPVRAREPQPADGATGVAVDSVLRWRAGREAVTHEVSLSTDQQAVVGGTAPVVTATESRFAPDDMEYGQVYYWKVDEVNEAATPGRWEGDVWSFATAEYAVIDDFESYGDEEGKGVRIYETWIDGWDDPTNNGGIVGYNDPPFAERTIVHGGAQSMPFTYDNTGAANVSEATRTFGAAQDWTVRGIKSLSLWFYGGPDNTGQMYVKINNTKVPYDGDAADIKRSQWQPWNIDLSAVGGNLRSVTKLTIGIDGAGTKGLLYFDDIRLYPKAPEYVTPTEPDNANLAARYALDGNVNDSSGHGFNGAANGSPSYAAGVEGQAIQLDGVDAHVVVANVGITGAAPRTISGWAKADQLNIPAWTNVFGFSGPSGNGGHFDIEAVGDTSTTTLGFYGLHRYGWEQDILPIDLEWHHLAATYDGATASWYGDGLLAGSVAVVPAGFNPPGPVHIGKREDNTNFFPGLVDEVRIYDRALSEGEIAWLAGKRTPAPKPF
jgi:hypothetical protein